VAKLEFSTTLLLASSSSYDITTEGEEKFQVEIANNSTVSSVELNKEAKIVTFKVEGKSGTRGVTLITIPKAMLSGEMMMIDGQVVSPERNNVIVASDTSTETTFKINFSHSEHDVTVSGTNVSPEFLLATLVMAGTVGSIVAALATAMKKRFGGWSWPTSFSFLEIVQHKRSLFYFPPAQCLFIQ
jgi:hypothetical protein